MLNRTEKLNPILATMLIISLTLYYFIFVANTAITYAIDMVKTNSHNVDFSAYFVNENGEKVDNISRDINSVEYLYVDIDVKNEGYFDGEIEIQNGNFRVLDKVEDSNIKNIKDNVISLSQINAGEIITIKAKIEFINNNNIAFSSLNQISEIILKGTYYKSNRKENINGISKVSINWNIPEGKKAEVATKLQTNNIYTVEEQEKRIVQILVGSRITDNAFPIKNTKIMVDVPEGTINTDVVKRTTQSTNGDKDFNYTIENNQLIINIENNENNGYISWEKNAKDLFVVTFELPKDLDISKKVIKIANHITTYDIDDAVSIEKSYKADTEVLLDKEEDGIVQIKENQLEKSFYKGKIYASEERDYTTYTEVNIDYYKGLSEIAIKNNESVFVDEEIDLEGNKHTNEINSNIQYKSLTINKDKIENVLGNVWNIKVNDQVITNESSFDENNNITLEFKNGEKALNISTSKPVNNGTLAFETVKTICKTEYTREQIKSFDKIKDRATILYVKNDKTENIKTDESNIELKETESRAIFKTAQTTISENEKNNQLDLIMVLDRKGEKRDLYKNVEFKITLPEEIKHAEIQDKSLIYGDGLNIVDLDTIEENGKQIVKGKLEGEQISYLGDNIRGTQINIKLNIELNEVSEDVTEEILLNYSNENASIYSDNGTQVVKLDILAKEEEEVNNQLDSKLTINDNQQLKEGTESNTNNNIDLKIKATIGDEEIIDGSRIKTGEIINYVATITNNGKEKIDNLSLAVAIPDMISYIEVNPKFPGYDEEIDEYTDTEDYFVKKAEKSITKENISIEAGKTKNIQFTLMVDKYIPSNFDGIVSANVTKEGKNIASAMISNRFVQGDIALILEPKDREPNEKLEQGYKAVYKLNIINISNETLNNLNVKINKNSAIDVSNLQYSINEGYTKLDKNFLNFDIDSLDPGDNAEVTIATMINIEDNLETADVSAIVSDFSGNTYRSNKLSNEIERKKVEIEHNSSITVGEKLQSNEEITYTYKIKNNGDLNFESMLLEDKISKYIEIKSVKLDGKTADYTVRDTVGKEYYYINISSKLEKDKESTLEITGRVKDISNLKEDTNVVNQLSVYEYTELMKTSSEITHLIEAEKKIEDNSGDNSGENSGDNSGENSGDNSGENSGDNSEKNSGENSGENSGDNSGENSGDNSGENSGNNSEDNSGKNSKEDDKEETKTLNSVSGIAWFDSNENGKREADEELLSGIKVSAINTKENKIIKTTITGDKGEYTISKLENGKYILIFEFDNDKYALTKYKAEGVNNDINSDVQKVTMDIDGETKNVASTDTFELKNENIKNIDIGLVNAKIFDLKLSKTINEIKISNAQGVDTIEYNDSTFAKKEIKAKYLSGSLVVIEYKIKVTNEGEIPGYVQEIVDYLPAGLNFNSSLNKDWYKEGENLYSKSLSNKKINPGKSEELTLILTKNMTESNTGLINNKAEISKAYNTLGIEDIDSKYGDKQGNNDDDLGSADVIISVSTGAVISYVVVTLSMIIIIGMVTLAGSKKIIDNKEII